MRLITELNDGRFLYCGMIELMHQDVCALEISVLFQRDISCPTLPDLDCKGILQCTYLGFYFVKCSESQLLSRAIKITVKRVQTLIWNNS